MAKSQLPREYSGMSIKPFYSTRGGAPKKFTEADMESQRQEWEEEKRQRTVAKAFR